MTGIIDWLGARARTLLRRSTRPRVRVRLSGGRDDSGARLTIDRRTTLTTG